MSKEFQWVLILLLAIGLQYLVTIYAFTMKTRVQTFTREFMKQFDDMHAKAFPGKE